MRLVANAWQENRDAERARDRAVARLSTIGAEVRKLGVTDPLDMPPTTFARWVCAMTAAASFSSTAFARWARHAEWHRVLQPGPGPSRSQRVRAMLYLRRTWRLHVAAQSCAAR